MERAALQPPAPLARRLPAAEEQGICRLRRATGWGPRRTLVATQNRGGALGKLKLARTAVRGRVRTTTFTGRLLPALFRALGIEVTLRRTDGGDDARVSRTTRLG